MSVLVYRTAVTGNAWIVNSKKGEPVSNAKDSSKNTIVVAALVRLLKFDKIKVQTYSSRDNSYVVKKSSSLSVVFVGRLSRYTPCMPCLDFQRFHCAFNYSYVNIVL